MSIKIQKKLMWTCKFLKTTGKRTGCKFQRKTVIRRIQWTVFWDTWASFLKCCCYRNPRAGGCPEGHNTIRFIPAGGSSLFWTQTQPDFPPIWFINPSVWNINWKGFGNKQLSQSWIPDTETERYRDREIKREIQR